MVAGPRNESSWEREEGLQAELSQPVAVLIDEAADVFDAANEAGFKLFVSIDAFKQYVERDVLAQHDEVDAAE